MSKYAKVRKDLKLNADIISIDEVDVGFYHSDYGQKNLKRKIEELEKRGFRVSRPFGELK